MNALSAVDAGFIIKSFDSINGKVNVAPYSPRFKYPQESYPVYSYDLTSFDPKQDLNTQLGKLIQPIVNSILLKENNEYSKLVTSIQGNINVTVSVPASAIAATLPVVQTGDTSGKVSIDPNVNFVA